MAEPDRPPAVPEPGTMSLLASGLGCGLLRCFGGLRQKRL